MINKAVNVLHPMPLFPEESFEIIDNLFDQYFKNALTQRTVMKIQ